MSNKVEVAIEELQAHFARGENLRLKRSRAQEHVRTIRSEVAKARRRATLRDAAQEGAE